MEEEGVLKLEVTSVNGKGYLLHIPARISRSERYPLIVTLSPTADARGMIGFWKNLSRRYGLIILASSEYRNGIDAIPVIENLAKIIRHEIIGAYPIDSGKVIAAGFSGGGMGAHAFSYEHPDLISAVIVILTHIINCMIPAIRNFELISNSEFIMMPSVMLLSITPV